MFILVSSAVVVREQIDTPSQVPSFVYTHLSHEDEFWFWSWSLSCPRPPSGVALASRTGNLNSSEIIAPTTPASSSHGRLGRAPTPHLISGLACAHGMVPGKNNGGLVGVLGPPPKEERGRKKIKAENGSSLLVVPYPILASGNDQSCAVITAKPGKTYRWGKGCVVTQLLSQGGFLLAGTQWSLKV